jgi:thiol:disulfide interchange protein
VSSTVLRLFLAALHQDAQRLAASLANLHLTGMRRNGAPLLLLTLTSLVAPSAAQGSPNHLTGQAAPYLRRALSQPVDWYPWGAGAFKRARELNRPILVDVGAVWCPWCTLMDRDTYTNPATANYINQQMPLGLGRFSGSQELGYKSYLRLCSFQDGGATRRAPGQNRTVAYKEGVCPL